MNRGYRFSALLLVFCFLSTPAMAEKSPIQILDMKTAQNIDDNYQPVNPMDKFSAKTAKVFCWFKWNEGELNAPMSVQWNYLTQRIQILDYKITIPRYEGSGGVALSMPEGRTLPAGEYQVSLVGEDKTVLKEIKFWVLEK